MPNRPLREVPGHAEKAGSAEIRRAAPARQDIWERS